MEFLGILPSSPRRSKESTSTKQHRSSSNINWDTLRTNHGSSIARPGSSVQLELSRQLPPTYPSTRPLPVLSSSSTRKVIRASSGRTLGVGSTTTSTSSGGGGRHSHVKVNMDSSLALSSSLNNPASDFSLSSVASPDSFVLALDNFSSDDEDDNDNSNDDNHRLSGSHRKNNYSWSEEPRSSSAVNTTSSSPRKVFLTDTCGESHSDFDPYLGNIRLKLPLHQQQNKPQKQSRQPIPPRPPPQSPSSVTRQRLHNPARHSTVTTCRNNTDVILQQRLQPQSFYRTTNANLPAAECGSDSTSPETASPSSSITGDVPGTGAVVTATPEADSATSWTLSLPSTLQLSQLITSLPRIRVSVASTNQSHNESKSTRIPPPPPSQATYLPFPTSVTALPPSTPITLTSRTPLAPLVATPEQVYWNRIVAGRTTQNHPDRTTTESRAAEAFYHLGNAHMRAKDYAQAWTAFQSAKGIWKSLHGPNHLSVAQASDAMGMAILRSSKTRPDLQLAKKALDVAFTIRYHVLGPWHVDTVDSYNKIASVHLHLLEYPEARACYEQVFLVRRAIFGPSHPSVAISAHSLANVHFHLSPVEESLRYYNIALDIYLHRMQLKSDHPTVARVLRDRKRLERVRMAEHCVQLVAAEGVASTTTHKNPGRPQQAAQPLQKQHSLLDQEREEDAYEIDEYTLSGGGGRGLNESSSENHSISMLTTSTMFHDGMKGCSAPTASACLETACKGRKVLI
jgi:tetratricopeptide (TPR) repeat protein